MAEPRTITIPLTEYENLKEDERLLEALWAVGVNNWEGFGDAIELLDLESDD